MHYLAAIQSDRERRLVNEMLWHTEKCDKHDMSTDLKAHKDLKYKI
jgi:hypothetical protein